MLFLPSCVTVTNCVISSTAMDWTTIVCCYWGLYDLRQPKNPSRIWSQCMTKMWIVISSTAVNSNGR
jgi:hypothetical protein